MRPAPSRRSSCASCTSGSGRATRRRLRDHEVRDACATLACMRTLASRAWLGALAVWVALALAGPAHARGTADGLPPVAVAELPREARDVLVLIERGGPFPHERDGVS